MTTPSPFHGMPASAAAGSLLMAIFLCAGQAFAQEWPETAKPEPAEAEKPPETRESILARTAITEDGPLAFPRGGRDSAWLNFYSSVYLAPKTSATLRDAIAKTGIRLAASEDAAKATVSVTGRVWVYRPADTPRSYINTNYTSAKVDMGELIEPNLGATTATIASAPPSPRDGKFLDFDLGVAQQMSRITGGGVPGVGAAMGIGWLADITGLSGAMNRGFENIIGVEKKSLGKTPLRRQCWAAACRRTGHAVELQTSVWEGTTRLDGYHTVSVQVDADDLDLSLFPALVEQAFMRLLTRINEAARP